MPQAAGQIASPAPVSPARCHMHSRKGLRDSRGRRKAQSRFLRPKSPFENPGVLSARPCHLPQNPRSAIRNHPCRHTLQGAEIQHIQGSSRRIEFHIHRALRPFSSWSRVSACQETMDLSVAEVSSDHSLSFGSCSARRWSPGAELCNEDLAHMAEGGVRRECKLRGSRVRRQSKHRLAGEWRVLRQYGLSLRHPRRLELGQSDRKA